MMKKMTSGSSPRRRSLFNLYRDQILDPASLRFMSHAMLPTGEGGGGQPGGARSGAQVREGGDVPLRRPPEESEAALKALVEHASDVCRGLGLPFRVLQLCTGDMASSAKSYDIEIWSPASEEWLEVSSCSNCTDFQARRANIRFRRERSGRPEFLHTLNGSGLGLPRVLIALLETYQQPDGSIKLRTCSCHIWTAGVLPPV